MHQFETIVFVDAVRGQPDRGWASTDVASLLGRWKVDFRLIYVSSPAELKVYASTNEACIYWPLAFTFDGDPNSLTIAEVLESLSLPYIGCNPSGCSLTSKLRLKSALVEAGIEVPHHQLISDVTTSFDGISYPGFIKAEFSCDSQGVRFVRDQREAEAAVRELEALFHHGFFFECVAGSTEWTIAGIALAHRCLSATIGLKAVKSDYIDASAKADNALLQISVPKPRESERLSAYMSAIAHRLALSGYFRLDVLTAEDGAILPIDLNLLPHLNCSPGHLSYLPMAFMLDTGCSYDEVVAAVIATGLGPESLVLPGSNLESFLKTSRLVSR